MEDNDTKKLIEKLVELTKNKVIKWDRLVNMLDNNGHSSNILLDKFLLYSKNDYNTKNTIFLVDVVDTFITKHKDGFVMIFNFKDDTFEDMYIQIAVQSSLSSSVVTLNNQDQSQAELKRLAFLIEDSINNIEGFISSFF
jgi:hypothetical protein